MQAKGRQRVEYDISIFYTIIPSPFGELAFAWTNSKNKPAVIEIFLPKEKASLSKKLTARYPGAREERHSSLKIFEDQLRAALNGEEVRFLLDFLDWTRCCKFQQRVLQKAFDIPRGMIVSYGGLAEKVGAPRAARAVGNAMARNPFPLVLPCHRIIRSTGHLGNFGGGIDLKRALLLLEGVEVEEGDMVARRFFWE